MLEITLQFVEGASSKFWSAKQDGVTVTVRYGRIGTDGQTQDKSYGSEADAKAAYEKQVAEKRKKGYTEAADGATVSAPATAPASGATVAVPGKKTSKSAKSAAPDAETRAETASAASTPALNFDPPRRIRLNDADRRRALVIDAPKSKPRPEPAVFDAEDIMARIGAMGKPGDTYYSWHWTAYTVPVVVSLGEAAFVSDEIAHLNISKKTIAKLQDAARAYQPPVWRDTIDDVEQRLTRLDNLMNQHPLLAMRCAWTLAGPSGVISVLAKMGDWYRHQALDKIDEAVLENGLTPDETAAFLDDLLVRGGVTAIWALQMAARLGADAAILLEKIKALPDGSGRPTYFGYSRGNEYIPALVGLRDPDEIARQALRLDTVPTTPADVRLLLAATEFRCLELIVESIVQQSSKSDAEKLANALGLAESPEVAEAMIMVMVETKAPHVARTWLDEHPAFAAEGLIPIAVTAGKRGEAALSYLKSMYKRGLGALLDAKLAGVDDGIAAAIREKAMVSDDTEAPELADDETPDWVKVVFGGALTVPDAPAEIDPPQRLRVEPMRLPVPPSELPAYTSLPPAMPFDQDASIAKLLAVHQGGYWRLADLEIGLPITRDEANFWISAIESIAKAPWNKPLAPSTLEAQLRAESFSIVRKLDTSKLGEKWTVVAWVAFGAPGLLALATNDWSGSVAQKFAAKILPHLDEAERSALKTLLNGRLRNAKDASAQGTSSLFKLADVLGFDSDAFVAAFGVLPELDVWRATRYFPYLFRLPDSQSVLAAAKRIGTSPQNESEARRWLSATGMDGVDRVLTILESRYYDKSEAARMLALIESPRVAPAMVSLRKFQSSRTIARTWLDRLPAFAVDALAPTVAGKGKDADPAIDYLREMKRRGLGWLIEKKIATMDTGVAAAVRTKILDYDPRKNRTPNASDQSLAALLPGIRTKSTTGETRRLTGKQMAMLIAEVRTTPLTEPSPTLELLKTSADRASVDAFALALLDDWLSGGAPSKDRWKLDTLGHLGGDAVALRLTPLIRAWPGESQHNRAVAGLDVLRAIGTDTALMQIHGIAEKVAFKGIKERAKECLEQIADARNLTPDELADRIVPDGGLDERGGKTFDFGPRRFTFALSGDLKSSVRDETGKRLPDLPKPNSKDDETMATEAIASWKLLKKQVSEVAKTQALRLEQAMVIGRRWTPTEFTQLFLTHPLMIHLVRRLIWCAYTSDSAPIATFRVADDNTLADSGDNLDELSEDAAWIGIVHPSHLSDAERGAWGEILADYEIIPPFVQLGRPTYALTADEANAQSITRFKGGRIDPKVLVFGLENLGWTRGPGMDGGCFTEHIKIFSGGVIAVVSYEGVVYMGDPSDWEPVDVTDVFFLDDEREARSGYVGPNKALPLKDIDPVIVSEVLHDVSRLAYKGKTG